MSSPSANAAHEVSIRLRAGDGSRCAHCQERIAARSGLVATVNERSLCEACLLQVAPSAGWAYALAERAAEATGGRWPSSAEGDELAGVVGILAIASKLALVTTGQPDLLLACDVLERLTLTLESRVQRMVDHLHELAAEHGLELTLDTELSMDDLEEALEKLGLDLEEFFEQLWERERARRRTMAHPVAALELPLQGSAHYRLTALPGEPSGECDRCGSRILTQSGLIGTASGRPLCERCLLEAAPAVGWAFVLAERVTGALAGRWPSTATGEELSTFFELLDVAQSFGPLVAENLEVQLALGVLTAAVAQAERLTGVFRSHLEELAEGRGIAIDVEELTLESLLRTLGELDVPPEGFFRDVLREDQRAGQARAALERLERRIPKP